MSKLDLTKTKWAINIQYRMTCSKTDARNMCHDRSRTDGYYWQSANVEEKQKQIEIMNIQISDSITAIQESIEKVEIPDNCEAILVKFTIHLPGSTGCNGVHRRNVEFEYFKDFKDC